MLSVVPDDWVIPIVARMPVVSTFRSMVVVGFIVMMAFALSLPSVSFVTFLLIERVVTIMDSMCFVSVVQECATGAIIGVFHGVAKGRVAQVALDSLALSYVRMGSMIEIAATRPEVGVWTDVLKTPNGLLVQVVTTLSHKGVNHL